MRLKFLFFPIMLVISTAIFIGYVWPEIGKVKKINEDKIAKIAELQAITEKQAAIESIGKKISDDIEGEDVVNNYLPENKTEERIISGINYLAGDANVSLVNISLSSPSTNVVNSENFPGAGALTSVAAAGLANQAAPSADQATSNEAGLAQATSVKISLIGDYDKIRIFLDSLQRMPILNTIKSISITKRQGETVEEGASDSTLALDVDVDFGYLGITKVGNQQLKKFEVGLDNETIDSLKKYISQKSQSIESENDTKGKINPFIAN